MKNLIVALVAVFALALAWSQPASACEGKCGGKSGPAAFGAEGQGGCGGGCAKAEGCSACGKADGKPCDKADCPHKAEGKGCAKAAKGECPHAQAAAAGAPADAVGQEATCPVTGEKFKVTADTASSQYEGKTYYFCCPGCKPRFDKDPAKFVGKK